MHLIRQTFFALTASAAALLLSGCALSPGSVFGPSLLAGSDSATPAAETPSTLFRLFEGKRGNALGGATFPTAAPSGSTTGVDAPPPGLVQSITPQLIQAMQRDVVASAQLDDVKPLFATPKPYTLGAGDVVHITVWGRPELVLSPAGGTVAGAEAGAQSAVGNGFNVSAEGDIQFPLIGTLRVAGLTENQARDALTTALKRYIVDPQVTFRIQAYRAGRVYIEGEVRSAGLLSVNDVPLTLPEAISRAGGLTATADRSQVQITRNGVTTAVNLVQLTQRGINPTQILLQHNDLVRIAHRDDTKVYVMGEVLRQAALPLRNGRLSLNEALGEAGGVNPASGDPRQIFVIRSRAQLPATADGKAPLPEIFHLDARSPMGYALAEGFELQARDVVYIDPVPLVRWNRVISLILPSAQAVTATRSAIN